MQAASVGKFNISSFY